MGRRVIFNVVGLYKSTSAVLLVIMIIISFGNAIPMQQQSGNIVSTVSTLSRKTINATIMQLQPTHSVHLSTASVIQSQQMTSTVSSCISKPCNMHIIRKSSSSIPSLSSDMIFSIVVSERYALSSSSHIISTSSSSAPSSWYPSVKPPVGQDKEKEDQKAVYLVLGVSCTLFLIVLVIVGFCMKGKCRARRPLEPISSWVTTETGADELLGSHESIELGTSRDNVKRKGIANQALDKDDESNSVNPTPLIFDMESPANVNETPSDSDSPSTAANPALQRYVSIRLLQEWLGDYKDQTSKTYCQLTTSVESEITHLYSNVHILESVNTLNVREGSVIIDLLLTFIAVCNFDPLSPLIVAVKKGRCGRFRIDQNYDLQQPFGQRIGRRSRRRQKIANTPPQREATETVSISPTFDNNDNRNQQKSKQNLKIGQMPPSKVKKDEHVNANTDATSKKLIEHKLESSNCKSVSKSKGIIQFVASANFVPSDSREVQLVIGEPVEIIARDQSGWTKVLKKNNDIGWVPASFLEKVSSGHLQSTLETVKTLHFFDEMLLAYDTSSGDSSSEASKGGSVDDDLYLKPVRDKIKQTDAESQRGHQLPPQQNQKTSVKDITKGDRYYAVFDYNAGGDSELSLRVGDVVDIIQISESGWWRGNCNDNIGWFPSSYLQVFDETKFSRKVKIKRSLSDGDEREKTMNSSDPRSPEYMDLVRSFVPPRKYSGLYVDLIKRTETKVNAYSEPIYAKPVEVGISTKDRSITVVKEEQPGYAEIDDQFASLSGVKQSNQASSSSGPSLPDRPAPSPQKIKTPDVPKEAPPRLHQSKRPMSVPGSHGEPPKRPVPPPPSKHSRRSSATPITKVDGSRTETQKSSSNLDVSQSRLLASTPRRGLSRSMNEINTNEHRHHDQAITRKRPLSLIGQRSPPIKPLPQLDRADGPEVPTRNRKAINIELLKEQLGETIVNRVGQERRSRSSRPHSTPNINLDQIQKANERFAMPSSRGNRYKAVEEEGSNIETINNDESSKKQSLRRNVSRSLSDASPLSSPVGNPSLTDLNATRASADELRRDASNREVILSFATSTVIPKNYSKEQKGVKGSDEEKRSSNEVDAIDKNSSSVLRSHIVSDHKKQKSKKPIPLPRTQQA